MTRSGPKPVRNTATQQSGVAPRRGYHHSGRPTTWTASCGTCSFARTLSTVGALIFCNCQNLRLGDFQGPRRILRLWTRAHLSIRLAMISPTCGARTFGKSLPLVRGYRGMEHPQGQDRVQHYLDAAEHCEERATSTREPPTAQATFAEAARCWRELARYWAELARG